MGTKGNSVTKKTVKENGAAAGAARDSKASNAPKAGSGFGPYSLIWIMLSVSIAALSTYWKEPLLELGSHARRLLNTSNGSMSASTCRANQYLTLDEPVPGFHVLCVDRKTDANTLNVRAFRWGKNDSLAFTSPSTFNGLRQSIAEALGIPPKVTDLEKRYKNDWIITETEGRHLHELDQVLIQGTVFVFEGGNFIWPGVRVGHTWTTEVDGVGRLRFTTLAMKPLVLSVDNFLKDEDVEHIQQLALPNLQESGVALKDVDKGKPATTWRTSTNTFLASTTDQLKSIDKRVEDITKVPSDHQEFLQVLRYELTQKYDAHHDYFDPDHYQTNEETLQMVEYGHKNRMITVFYYMSDVPEGGHTWFPRAGGLEYPERHDKCEGGLLVPPRKGSVVIFYSMRPDGSMDPFSLHGGCPVKQGTKWAANKWVWNKVYR